VNFHFKNFFKTNANTGIYFIGRKSENSALGLGPLNDCYNMLFPKVNKISVHISTV